jgi:chromosome segregation ATPase
MLFYPNPRSEWHPYATTIAPADYDPPTRALTPGNPGLRRVVVLSGSSREWELQDENADLKRKLQDSQQIVSCLQSERDGLKTEVAGLQAQLSYATGTLTTQFRKELDDIRPEATLNQRLKEQSAMKNKAIHRLTTEAAEQFKTVKQLKSEINNKNTMIDQLQSDRKKAVQDFNNARRNINSYKPRKLSKAEKRKQRQEAEMANGFEKEGLLISKFV